MMIEVPLTQGMVALIDDEDAEMVLAHKWCAHKDGGGRSMYAERHDRDAVTGIDHMVKMHRVIMGAVPGEMIDHINHNGLDNRRINLRFCTNRENQHNRRKDERETTSRFKGVYWHKGNKEWEALIKAGGRRVFLGGFRTQEEAAQQYDIAAVEYYGEFACLNFPDTPACEHFEAWPHD